jgi:hypothetical protein
MGFTGRAALGVGTGRPYSLRVREMMSSAACSARLQRLPGAGTRSFQIDRPPSGVSEITNVTEGMVVVKK